MFRPTKAAAGFRSVLGSETQFNLNRTILGLDNKRCEEVGGRLENRRIKIQVTSDHETAAKLLVRFLHKILEGPFTERQTVSKEGFYCGLSGSAVLSSSLVP